MGSSMPFAFTFHLAKTYLILSVTSMPSSSYRLGVKAASLHELFPIYMTDALRYSIAMFDKEVFYISLIRITLQFQFFLLISKLN